jgi:thymidylate synthase (FAD)
MEVVLMALTKGVNGEPMNDIVSKSMIGCQSTKAAFEIKPSEEKTKEMIEMAIEKGHESVLEHAVFTFSVKGISRACSHQLVRHRIASYSQQSQRHVNPTKVEDWYVTPDSWEEQAKRHNIGLLERYHGLMREIAALYKEAVEEGIPGEDARFVLTNACKTNIVITMNVRELRHFFKLRRAKDAQWEIREMANKMYELVVPIAKNMFKRK